MNQRKTRYAILLSLLFILIPRFATGSDRGTPPDLRSAQPFSADDFDWREMIPALAAAAELPADQGVKELLENCGVLRAYVASQLLAECKSNKNHCADGANRSAFEPEVTARIDRIIDKEIATVHKTAVVDYQFARQPFPFSEIAAYRSENRQDAYLVLALPADSYTSLRVRAKYGAPFDDDIFQWYGVYKYRLDNAEYRSEAVFEIDPPTDAVLKIAISFKPKKHRRATKPY
jgi:hypothetical protein